MRVNSPTRRARSKLAAGAAFGLLLLALPLAYTVSQRPSDAGCPFSRGAKTSGDSSGPSTLAAAIRRPPRADAATADAAPLGPATHARALGLVLGEAKRDQVFDWGAMHGAGCRYDGRGKSVVCTSERPSDVGEDYRHASALTVFFDLDDRATVDRIRLVARYAGVERATEALLQASQAAALQAGAPIEVTGELSSAYLAAGALRQVRLHYARDNLVAQLSATNFGSEYHLVHTMQVR